MFKGLVAMVVLTCSTGAVAFAADGVCGAGTGVPPFLSSGINPNLLLVVDNSGSMLEMAYSDTTGDGACVDNDFDPTKNYAGLFDSNKWYRWNQGVQQQWTSGKTYAVGDYVYTEGVFYKATAVKNPPVASTGTDISSDTSVSWARVHNTPSWTSGVSYPPHSFVQYKNQLYYTAAGGKASGVSIDQDTGVIWVARDSTWLNNHLYTIGDVVSDQGMLFRATSGGTSSGTGVANDTVVKWARLGEGYFEEVLYSTSTAAATDFTSAAGIAYQHDNLFVKIISVTSGGTTTPVGVSAFAASGKLLNWASASKLDIQKKILTGGKYHPGQELLVSEGRGCSSRGFIKEVPVRSSAGASVLTFSIRGHGEENWIDSADFTTRIAIMGVSTQGFIGTARQKSCQLAIDEVAKGVNANQGLISKYTGECLLYSGNDPVLAQSNASYNHSIHTCWTITKQKYTKPEQIGNVSEVQNACGNIYGAGVQPPTIEPSDSSYVCSGLYNSKISYLNREGYVGRCWEPSSIPAGCTTKSCNGPYGVGESRCYSNLTYQCSGNYNSSQDECNKPWSLVLVQDPASTITCNPSAATNVTPAQWTDDLTGDPTQCIQQGLWDYCGSLKIPEVIDPTDQLFNTSETWGMVGAMVDSGVVSLFGTDRPLIVMKGYIKPPRDANNNVNLQGKIQEFADSLRIGAMAFTNNGSATECLAGNTSQTIDRYCPKQNRDGAEIIAPIKDSNATTAGENHLKYLVKAINGIRATSWTPLAEALYNALGYYGQNQIFRIQADDFKITSEDDPVKAWCQANNILIITEGASTADVNVDVANRVTMTAKTLDGYAFDTTREGECTMTGIVPVGTTTNHYLYGSTYLDDLTYFGQHAIDANIYTNPQMQSDDGESEDKQNIRTYVVKTGNASGPGKDNDCDPNVLIKKAAQSGGTVLLPGENPDDLNNSLRAALADILSRASAGSAASVISSARSGEGAIYQAIFWPELTRSGGGVEYKVEWAGDVHGLFIDKKGFMYEDTNQNRMLDLDPTTGDKRVVIYFDATDNKSKACYGEPTVVGGAVNCASGVELEKVRFLWSANDWLSGLGNEQTKSNRNVKGDGRFDFLTDEGNKKRFIFTWVDLNHDGVVDSGETLELEKSTDPNGAGWNSLAQNFMVKDGYELNNLINWLRGEDWLITEKDLDGDGKLVSAGEVDYDPSDGPPRIPYRSRKIVDNNGKIITWRLGDIINSTPVTVTAPAEGYHLLYNDVSYAGFVTQYKKRRHVVYFGGNDGMLHAVNAGFFSEAEKKFCLSPETNACDDVVNGPALGTELWAYVPYNLQPHLKCLANPQYAHKYYVDLKPRVFDAQIFANDEDHPDGWGTILVGGMRFGGAPAIVPYLDKTDNSTKYKPFVSAYFILDITNPEKPPVLLGELTQEFANPTIATGLKKGADLGYTTTMPSMVIAKNKAGTENNWYLVFGSGPHGENGLKGVSDQQAKISVFPLHNLVDTSNKPTKAMRIAAGRPTAANSGTFFLPTGTEDSNAPKGFVSDLITVDFDINPSASGQYISDAVYFGTVEGAFDYDSGPTYWKGGGSLYRLVMNGNGHQIGSEDVYTPDFWSIKPLINLGGNSGQPITAASSVGTDGYNYWIYFGTGRFFDADDKTDNQQQSYYGIKEPMGMVTGTDGVVRRNLTWGDVNKVGVSTDPAGRKGLLQVDKILVKQSGSPASAQLACRNDAGELVVGDYSCLPSGLQSAENAYLSNLEIYIAGTGSCSGTSFINCADGWYRDFFPYKNRERNLGQATLLGGLVTFATYQPYSDICKPEGGSYLYGVYYKTGTSWSKNVFGDYGTEYGVYVRNKLNLGRGLTTTPNLFTGGGLEGAKAFVQTSTGEIMEIEVENLPINNYKTGRESWQEYQRP